ncbi:MAG TPA: hypothetical protein VKA68_09215 [bacterium]|nr:hypothetical protein [bacterium]
MLATPVIKYNSRFFQEGSIFPSIDAKQVKYTDIPKDTVTSMTDRTGYRAQSHLTSRRFGTMPLILSHRTQSLQ